MIFCFTQELLSHFEGSETNWERIFWINEMLYFSQNLLNAFLKKGNVDEKREPKRAYETSLSFLRCAFIILFYMFISDTLLRSNSHKCNPLCCIMLLFTFQVFGVVRGTLIHWFVAFHTHCVSVSLSLFVHPLPLYIIQISNTHLPPAPLSLLTHIPIFLLFKRRGPGLFNPTSVGPSSSYLSSCEPSASGISDGGWDSSIKPPHSSFSTVPWHPAWCSLYAPEEAWMSLPAVFLLSVVCHRWGATETCPSAEMLMNAEHVTVVTAL